MRTSGVVAVCVVLLACTEEEAPKVSASELALREKVEEERRLAGLPKPGELAPRPQAAPAPPPAPAPELDAWDASTLVPLASSLVPGLRFGQSIEDVGRRVELKGVRERTGYAMLSANPWRASQLTFGFGDSGLASVTVHFERTADLARVSELLDAALDLKPEVRSVSHGSPQKCATGHRWKTRTSSWLRQGKSSATLEESAFGPDEPLVPDRLTLSALGEPPAP